MPRTQTLRVDVRPALLRWARERARLDHDELIHRFPKLDAWEDERERPTFKQLEEFAKATHAPFGYFFLQEPPVEALPIPDFRTIADRRIERPSPDLLDTLYLCQQRQEWYRDFMRVNQGDTVDFVGSATIDSDIPATAARMRATLGFETDERRDCPTWSEALRRFIERTDAAGVLVMVNGVVGSNTHRRLDPQEFRGFALSDELAPLVFVNGADTKSAQMFTLAHELAHLWLGQSALSNAEPSVAPAQRVESWCNRVAAEFLVPLASFREVYRRDEPLDQALARLSRLFKVSMLVVLRRIRDAGGLSGDAFWTAYGAEVQRLLSFERGGGGGDFYRTLSSRVGKRFARALVVSTLEGQTLYREAFHLLGFSKFSTFQELAHNLGIA